MPASTFLSIYLRCELYETNRSCCEATYENGGKTIGRVVGLLGNSINLIQVRVVRQQERSAHTKQNVNLIIANIPATLAVELGECEIFDTRAHDQGEVAT